MDAGLQDSVDDELPVSALVETKKPTKKMRDPDDSDLSPDEWSESEESSESDIDLEGQKMEDLRRFFLK